MNPIETPYAGLVPYTEAQAAFFFGREHERDIVISNLMAARLTIFYGASGVGKSSVLRAGVIPQLNKLARDNIVDTGKPEFAVVSFSSWRDDPIRALIDRIYSAVSQTLSQPPPAPSDRLDLAVQDCARQLGGNLLVILDQFEEYFLYHAYEDGDGTFACEFPRIVNDPRVHVDFLISIREDALAKLDRFKGRIPNLFTNYLRLDHLDRQAARSAIEKPIEEFNRRRGDAVPAVTIEPALVDAVLDQVRTGNVALRQFGRGLVDATGDQDVRIETPFLQLVMTRLWGEERTRGSGVLRLETLASLGGAVHLVQTHLDSTMAAFTPDEQDVAARIFHHLVTPSGTKIAHTATDLADYTGLASTQLTPVLEKLSSGSIRILRPIAPPAHDAGEMRYEIFHDVLAAPILDWRARFVEAQTRAAADAKLAQEQSAAKEALAVERRKSRLLTGALALAVAVLGVMLALVLWARAMRTRAETMREAAGHARGQSEQLVAFLIGEDLLERLKRLSLMTMREEAQKKVDDYLAGVPRDLVTRGSRTTSAFASLNAGDLAFLRGNLDDARQKFQAAIDQFRTLRHDDSSDTLAAGGLAASLERGADLAEDEGHVHRAEVFREEAVELRNQIAARQPIDDRPRRRLAEAHVQLAELLRRQGRLREASAHVDEATHLIEHAPNRSAPEWQYVEADMWDARGSIAADQGRGTIEKDAYQKFLKTGRRLIQSLPFEAQAQYTYGLSLYRNASWNPAEVGEALASESVNSAAQSHAGAQDRKERGGVLPATSAVPRRINKRSEEQIQANAYLKLFDTIEAMSKWEPQNVHTSRELEAARMWKGLAEGVLQQPHAQVELYRQALAAFESLSKREPTNASFRGDVVWAHQWLAELEELPKAQRLEHYRAALAVNEELSRLDPDDRDVAYEQARMEIERGDLDTDPAQAMAAYERARSLLEGIKTIDPEDEAYSGLLNLCHTARAKALAHNDPSGSLQAARQAVAAAAGALRASRQDASRIEEYAAALRLLGRRQQDTGDQLGAGKSFDEALASLRNGTSASRPEDAASIWNQAFLVLYVDIAPLRTAHGDREGALQSYRESLAAAEKAAQLAPDDPVYHSNAAAAFRSVGDALRDHTPADLADAAEAYASAEHSFTKAAALATTAGDAKEAASDWNRIFLLYNDHVVGLHTKRGDTAAVSDAYQRALAAAETAIKFAPDDPVYHSNIATARRSVGDTLRDRTPADLAGAADAYAKAEQSWNTAAALATAAQDAKEAASDWNQIFLLYYDHIVALQRKREDTAAVPGTYQRAIAAVETAIKLDPSEPVYRVNLALGHVRIGDSLRGATPPNNAGALAQYRTALTELNRPAVHASASANALVEIARTHHTIAKVLDDTNKTQESLSEYARGIEAAQRAVALKADSAVAWNELATCAADRGVALNVPGHSEEVRALLQTAVRAEEHAVALDPKEPMYRTSLSRMGVWFGDFLKETDPSTAADAYARAITVVRADTDPTHQADYNDPLADAYSAAAAFYAERQSSDKADAHYALALPYVRTRATRSPEDVDSQLALVNLLLLLGNSARVPDSAGFQVQAIGILRSLESAAKLSPEWKARLAQLTHK